ncbi:MAG: hypothetical protein Ct9H90mP27_6520 [Gammaproteobacteria bacterium]|nr:MAG: hypothetical protein Ct9H90mP27_6520 [Gammaproteobacteria bacterium]
MVAAAGVPEEAMKDFLDGVESKWGRRLDIFKRWSHPRADGSIREIFLSNPSSA